MAQIINRRRYVQNNSLRGVMNIRAINAKTRRLLDKDTAYGRARAKVTLSAAATAWLARPEPK